MGREIYILYKYWKLQVFGDCGNKTEPDNKVDVCYKLYIHIRRFAYHNKSLHCS